jgi:hypothetical protein
VLAVLLLVAGWFLPHHVGVGIAQWRPHAPTIPKLMRAAFTLASLAAYTHGLLVLSFGSELIHDLIGTQNALVGGAVLSLIAIVSGVATVAAMPVPARTAVFAGALTTAAIMALLALAFRSVLSMIAQVDLTLIILLAF